jgi:glycosyltransferase involved in cell wall biosynthesis
MRLAERKFTSIRADRTCTEADLVNVSNDADRAELLRRGIAGGKIVVIPFGLTRERLAHFETVAGRIPPGPPRVAFVGTFDARKGGAELPEIVEQVARAVPEVRFKLLGARYRSEAETLAFFPARLHRHLELVSHYAPEGLPALLSDCWTGVFPSHVEGFGFGVLEMLAAAIPVVAYDAPGPPMMLPMEYLVPRGDTRELARKLSGLLLDPTRLASARLWARKRAAEFSWEKFARLTVEAYAAGFEKLQK